MDHKDNTKNYLKLFGFLFSVSLFVFPFFVKAENPVLDYENTLTGVDMTTSNPFGEAFRATKSSLTRIVLQYNHATPTYNEGKEVEYWVCEGSPDLYSYATTYACGAGNNIVAHATTTLTRVADYYVALDFTSVPLNVGHNYYFSATGTSIAISFEYNAFYTLNPYEYLLTDDYGDYTKKRTLAYKRYYDSEYSDIYLDIDVPTEYDYTSIRYKDFPQWLVDYDLSTTTSPFYIRIDYGKNPLDLDYVDIQPSITTSGDTRVAITKMNDLDDGFWYAQARIYYNHYSVGQQYVSTSTLREFYIDNVNGTDDYLGGYVYNTIASSTIFNDYCLVHNISTSTLNGQMFCATASFINSVMTTVQNVVIFGFANAKDLMIGVFPFSLIAEVKNSWEASEDQPMLTELAYLNTYLDASGNIYLYTPEEWSGTTSPEIVFGSTLFDEEGLGDFFDFIRVFTTFTLWFIFIMFVLKTALNVLYILQN